MNRNDLAVILTCSLFRSVADAALARGPESLPYRMTTHDPGNVILTRNDRYEDLIIIVSGALEALQEDRCGHSFIVESLKAPEAVATAILFSPEPRIPVTLKATETSRLFSISRKSVLWLCSRYEGVMSSLLSDMGARAAFLANKLRFQAFSSIRQKLAVFLAEQMALGRESVRVSKEHLAETFGVNRPSLSRVCREMADQGIIRIEKRSLVILRPDRVTELADFVEDR